MVCQCILHSARLLTIYIYAFLCDRSVHNVSAKLQWDASALWWWRGIRSFTRCWSTMICAKYNPRRRHHRASDAQQHNKIFPEHAVLIPRLISTLISTVVLDFVEICVVRLGKFVWERCSGRNLGGRTRNQNCKTLVWVFNKEAHKTWGLKQSFMWIFTSRTRQDKLSIYKF